MRILIYVGYQKKPFNPDTIKTSGIGGTELACIKLSEELSRFGWEVFVSGSVLPGKFGLVKWIPTHKLHKQYFNYFDVIIGASYIHFLLEFDRYGAKKIFWAHNTDYHAWWNGKKIPQSKMLLNNQKLSKIVCLTDWHKNQWSNKYGVDNIEVIGNGIDLDSFHGRPRKVKNSFIWSSAPSRGLSHLLENWSKIKAVKPDATLNVYYPDYASRDMDKLSNLIDQDGVTVHGSVSQEDLHAAMLKSDYWAYLTGYEETYCITALEMQYAGVVPITTNVAALNETIHSGIVLDYKDSRYDEALSILERCSSHIIERVRYECINWSKNQTWSSRAYDWKKLIQSL